jgi:large repetitive protein
MLRDRGGAIVPNTYLIAMDYSGINYYLYYAERFWTATGKRVFNVDVEGQRVSTNLDLFKMASGAHAAMIVPVYHVAVSGGALTMDFRAVADYGAINGIRVTADP